MNLFRISDLGFRYFCNESSFRPNAERAGIPLVHEIPAYSALRNSRNDMDSVVFVISMKPAEGRMRRNLNLCSEKISRFARNDSVGIKFEYRISKSETIFNVQIFEFSK
ncbi:MAG: hypothetical protein D6707_07370 [Bacteroidetes bacterium]|nr:MAG: hypothetical protein D6707_07370 [Bacteroidota bacterium]